MHEESITDIVADPTAYPIPATMGERYALTTLLAGLANDYSIAAILTFCWRMSPEFAVMVLTMAVNRNPGLANIKAVVDFCKENAK